MKARPGREKTKWRYRPGSVSTLRIQSLASVVFSVLACTFSESNTAEINSVDQPPPKLKVEFRTPRQSSISCAGKTGEEEQSACRKIQIEFVSKHRAAEHPMQWVKKQKTGLLHRQSVSRENHRQSKPKEGKVEVGDLRGTLVRSSQAQSKAVRTLDVILYRVYSCLDLGPETGRLQHV